MKSGDAEVLNGDSAHFTPSPRVFWGFRYDRFIGDGRSYCPGPRVLVEGMPSGITRVAFPINLYEVVSTAVDTNLACATVLPRKSGRR